ncbi:hypothetical protein MCOR27_001927 [Pyricularia oryzae]|uniref:Uncharacterized protein n=2 Tax=Pyricularia TaxID=48558 RepID=A0ABQ8NQZ0_PYRGI|nr:hypothetical protein MCOR01_004029 [Pyricularia oryzae]KAI6300672.1 hypothetical protein MCOR33_003701 [Pyricularia grisea]KAH9430665.1 hypothetical protein MCOR02_008001 [Pyricularia oryzae]KAI6263659.1 hypothetical protein MCOR19_000294 [Pyricularia oryzae]KAI6264780.1 hypothetical protein MCOR26_011135 [Pyricularia oryzae]
MQFSATTLLLLATAASAASISRRTDGGDDYTTTATLTPFLAPACEVSNLLLKPLCNFAPIGLAEGSCVDVTQPCPVHPPTSFKARLDQAAKGCYVTVFPNFGCTGDQVATADLTTDNTMCTESPYLAKLLNGGFLSSASLLPFGFKSAKLVCN